MRIKAIWLRTFTNGGLVIGLQFVWWAIRGTAMALRDTNWSRAAVAPNGGAIAMPAETAAWSAITRHLGSETVESRRSQTVLGRSVVEVATNHALIVAVSLAMAWLAVTGFWLLFRTMWRHDLAWVGRLRLALP